MTYNQYYRHKDWTVWAIIGTLAGAVLTGFIGSIFGVIGIIYSNKANMAHRMGNDNEAAVHNSTAKAMTIVSLVISGLVILSIFILILLIILNVWSSNYTLEDTLPYYCY